MTLAWRALYSTRHASTLESMSCRSLRLYRWSLRRSLLGVALVLHVVWLALSMPVSAHAAAAGGGMPCHEAMQAVPAPHATAPHAPAHMPCCTQHCACASSLCALLAAAPERAALRLALRAPPDPSAAFHDREPSPELRPPILH